VTEFFHVITADQFIEKLAGFNRIGSEAVPLDDALGRILVSNIVAHEDLPEGARSTVDGYAVRAADTFGASESIPALMELARPVSMGIIPDFKLLPGQAAPILTGGFLPEWSDAVVMVEYSNAAGSGSIEISHPVTLRTNVVDKGEDARAGEAQMLTGKKLRPQEIGFLAALGYAGVEVRRRPKVAVISSGDEVIPVEKKPRPGQIRDANGHSVAALVRAAGGVPVSFDIVPDKIEILDKTLREALALADVVALSGGSSVGTRDLMASCVAALPGAEILAHGIAVKPGKPTLLGRYKGKAIFGLPGHPVSALVIAQIFLAPFLDYLGGAPLKKGPAGYEISATLSSSLHSEIGLEEYIRVSIEEAEDGTRVAYPVMGKSGMLSTLAKADGIVRVPMNAEGLSRGETVTVIQY
jgi:molybdopterin molybdotransferase